jgi:hypothetical protein
MATIGRTLRDAKRSLILTRLNQMAAAVERFELPEDCNLIVGQTTEHGSTLSLHPHTLDALERILDQIDTATFSGVAWGHDVVGEFAGVKVQVFLPNYDEDRLRTAAAARFPHLFPLMAEEVTS